MSNKEIKQMLTGCGVVLLIVTMFTACGPKTENFSLTIIEADGKETAYIGYIDNESGKGSVEKRIDGELKDRWDAERTIDEKGESAVVSLKHNQKKEQTFFMTFDKDSNHMVLKEHS